MSECDRDASITRKPGPLRDVPPYVYVYIYIYMTKHLRLIDFSATLYDIAHTKSPPPDVLYNSVSFNEAFSTVQ